MALIAKTYIKEYPLRILPRHSYPDLAPLDFLLFLHLEKHLRRLPSHLEDGMKFEVEV